ncbi:hypothetical protein D9M71_402110 [compost metagenome]
MKTGTNASTTSAVILPLVAIAIFHIGIVFIIHKPSRVGAEARSEGMAVELLMGLCYMTIFGLSRAKVRLK